MCRAVLYKLCPAVFVCFPYVSVCEGKRKENSGKQSRAGGTESKQTSPQLPSLTYTGVHCSSRQCRLFWVNSSRSLFFFFFEK